eukprot:304665-Rhodomonas_salina.2
MPPSSGPCTWPEETIIYVSIEYHIWTAQADSGANPINLIVRKHPPQIAGDHMHPHPVLFHRSKLFDYK